MINPFINIFNKPASEEGDDFTPLSDEEKKSIRRKKIGNVAKGSLYGIDAIASYNLQQNQTEQFDSRVRNINQQAPIFDYNAMYGEGTNGGSEFQPIIKAKNGAIVRTGTDKSAPFKIDHNEFLVLPDGTTEIAKGNPNKTDDISTILPDGTMIFSNELTPTNSKKTFAQVAKTYDFANDLETLKNPYSNQAAKNTAARMMERKQKSLQNLFKEQQSLNGDSTGEMDNAMGGTILNKGQEVAYRQWMNNIGHTKKAGYNVDDEYNGNDYDYRGYWKQSQMNPNSKNLLDIGENQHFPDTFKLPNHESHSNESVYKAVPRNSKGFWEDDTFIEFKHGGLTEGQELELTESQIAQLKKQGYNIEIL